MFNVSCTERFKSDLLPCCWRQQYKPCHQLEIFLTIFNLHDSFDFLFTTGAQAKAWNVDQLFDNPMTQMP